MNILWISHNVPYPPKGGVLQRNYNLLKGVAAQHNVYLIAFNQKALLPAEGDIAEARKALEGLCTCVEIVPIPSDMSPGSWYKLVLFSFFSRDPYTVNWLKSKEMRLNISVAIQKTRFDIVHYDTISLVEYFRDTGKIPKVLNHHNVESAMMRRRAENEKNILKKIYFLQEAVKLKWVEQRFCKKFDMNLVVSFLDRENLNNIVPNVAISVVPNGVDTDYFKPEPDCPATESLVMVGGMSWYPNRDAALYFFREIWPRISAKFPKAVIEVIGRKPPAELVSLAEKDQRISILGFVDDIRPHLNKATVYVCTIRDGGGTRLKILDALAMGKAIVCTSVACEGIDVVHGKHLLIADDPAKFTDHIAELFVDSVKRSLLEKEAKALASARYDWRKIARDLNAAYNSAIVHQSSAFSAGNS